MIGGKEEHIMAVPDLVAKWPTSAPFLLSVLRIVAAFMFVLYGTMKLFAVPAGMLPHGGTVPLLSELGVAGILETLGGGLLVLGLFTRPVAFLVAGEMAVAYFQVAFPQGHWPVTNQGVPAVLYCFLWLYVSAAGPGPWSLDAKRRGLVAVVSRRGLGRGRVGA
jgi:putative oxidoreductase